MTVSGVSGARCFGGNGRVDFESNWPVASALIALEAIDFIASDTLLVCWRLATGAFGATHHAATKTVRRWAWKSARDGGFNRSMQHTNPRVGGSIE